MVAVVGGGELQYSAVCCARSTRQPAQVNGVGSCCYVAIEFKATKEAYHSTGTSKEGRICR